MKIVEMFVRLCYTYYKGVIFVEVLLFILLFIPAIVFVVMMIYVIGRAIRFGENRPQFTKAASIAGIIAGLISIAASVVKLIYLGRGIGGFISAAFCLAFAFVLRLIVKFFEEDFDKKHQIPVNPNEKLYRFEFEQENPDDFLDEDSRFNGKFKNFDNDD